MTYEEFGNRICVAGRRGAARDPDVHRPAGHDPLPDQPAHVRDSRAFLRQGMFRFGVETEVLGRDPQLYGLRLVFPRATSRRTRSPCGSSRTTVIPLALPREPGDVRALITGRSLTQIEENVRSTYVFLRERAIAFVARFDARQEA